MFIKFESDNHKSEILLNGKVLHWGSKVKHIGNVSLHDKDDIQLKWQEFFHKINKLLGDCQGF